MSLTLRTTFGCTEAVIDGAGNLKRFYQVAALLTEDLEVRFTQKEDDFDAISWDFSFRRHLLTLHYSIYNGISVFPTKTKDAKKKENHAVVELARILESKLMESDKKQITAARKLKEAI